jgi:DNA-binding beta-propeller fold protein YncE
MLAYHVSSAQKYYVYVTAESEDEVALISFDARAGKSEVEKVIPVGTKPADIEGPHGITVSPDGQHWYLSMAHGNPNGFLYKFKTGTDEFVGETTLGIFPASMQISPVTGYLFCVNFNLHGEMVPSTVSVVEPNTMTEITQVPVGTMPHGSRISADGLKQYSVAMMSGELFEINTMNFKVSRILNLDTNMPVDPASYGKKEMDHSAMGHQGMDHASMGHSMEKGGMTHSATKPTWVTPHPTKQVIYVAGNGTDEILEIDAVTWKVTNKMKTGKAPYNLDITPDGKKLIASYKGDAATGIWDLETRQELARISNTRKVTHGVAVSPDNRYAFISVEGIGGEPGTMDVIDLVSLKKVASANLGKQAGGIAFWKIEE